MKYYSEFGEDEFLDKLGVLPEKGFFVDVGAGDGVTFSNTYFLEERGWEGLCFDPNPMFASKLAVSRKNVFLCGIAKASKLYTLNLTKFPEGNFIGDPAGEHVSVWCMPLAEIVKQYAKEINLLSIDAEGMDIEVWNTIYPEFEPKIVIFEHFIYHKRNQWSIAINAFDNLPYKLLLENEQNAIYQHI